MFQIDDDNNIYLTRGDSAIVNLAIVNEENEPYELQDGDSVVLSVKKSTRQAEKILEKEFDNARIEIEPMDTSELNYGKYVYDVQLTTATGRVFTVIPPRTFNLSDEVSW